MGAAIFDLPWLLPAQYYWGAMFDGSDSLAKRFSRCSFDAFSLDQSKTDVIALDLGCDYGRVRYLCCSQA